MKKYLLVLFILSALVITTSAQTSTSGAITLQGTYTNTLGLDTLGASDTIYFKNPTTMSSIGLDGKYTIAITAVSLSGTVSATITLERSTDGVVWTTGLNKVPGTDGKHCDTLTISSAGTYYMTVASSVPKQLITAGVVGQTYYTNNTRTYFIRAKVLSPSGTQSTKMYARLTTQN